MQDEQISVNASVFAARAGASYGVQRLLPRGVRPVRMAVLGASLAGTLVRGLAGGLAGAAAAGISTRWTTHKLLQWYRRA
jgi:hypothetical protein